MARWQRAQSLGLSPPQEILGYLNEAAGTTLEKSIWDAEHAL